MTNKGLELIKKFEGCKLKAYLCPAGVPTIGYGTTVYNDGTKVQIGDEITQLQADELLRSQVAKYEAAVRRLVPPTLSDESVDALTSFAYNLGVAALTQSKLLKVVKGDKNNLPEIERQFMRWVYAGGKVLAGLKRRRAAEFELYRYGVLSQYTREEVYTLGVEHGKGRQDKA